MKGEVRAKAGISGVVRVCAENNHRSCYTRKDWLMGLKIRSDDQVLAALMMLEAYAGRTGRLLQASFAAAPFPSHETHTCARDRNTVV